MANEVSNRRRHPVPCWWQQSYMQIACLVRWYRAAQPCRTTMWLVFGQIVDVIEYYLDAPRRGLSWPRLRAEQHRSVRVMTRPRYKSLLFPWVRSNYPFTLNILPRSHTKFRMTLVHIDPRNILPSGMVFQPLPTDESCISRPLSYRVRNYALEMIGDLRKDLDNDEHLTLDDLKAIRHISILLKPHINVLAAMIGDNSKLWWPNGRFVLMWLGALDDAASLLKESLRDLQGALQSLRDDLEQSCSFTKDQLKTLIKTEISYSEERLRNPNRLEAKIASELSISIRSFHADTNRHP